MGKWGQHGNMEGKESPSGKAGTAWKHGRQGIAKWESGDSIETSIIITITNYYDYYYDDYYFYIHSDKKVTIY